MIATDGPSVRVEYTDTDNAQRRQITLGRFYLRWGTRLEDQVEIDTHAPVVVPEELAILRVGSVGMNFQRVEVVHNVVNDTEGLKVYLELTLISLATRASAEKYVGKRPLAAFML